MTYYRRRTLEGWEEAAALAAGALVGMGAAYLARIWLRRAPAGEHAPGPEDEGGRAGAAGDAAARRPPEGEAGRRR